VIYGSANKMIDFFSIFQLVKWYIITFCRQKRRSYKTGTAVHYKIYFSIDLFFGIHFKQFFYKPGLINVNIITTVVSYREADNSRYRVYMYKYRPEWYTCNNPYKNLPHKIYIFHLFTAVPQETLNIIPPSKTYGGIRHLICKKYVLYLKVQLYNSLTVQIEQLNKTSQVSNWFPR
jgi:hypothetical protein